MFMCDFIILLSFVRSHRTFSDTLMCVTPSHTLYLKSQSYIIRIHWMDRYIFDWSNQLASGAKVSDSTSRCDSTCVSPGAFQRIRRKCHRTSNLIFLFVTLFWNPRSISLYKIGSIAILSRFKESTIYIVVSETK